MQVLLLCEAQVCNHMHDDCLPSSSYPDALDEDPARSLAPRAHGHPAAKGLLPTLHARASSKCDLLQSRAVDWE
eukprot:9477121-Pyramimonas_sp.AAC.1